jgi:hypothetical protein
MGHCDCMQGFCLAAEKIFRGPVHMEQEGSTVSYGLGSEI